MTGAVATFWAAVVCILFILASGTIHYRINKSTDIFYSVLLLIGVLVMVVSGVVWVVTNGG